MKYRVVKTMFGFKFAIQTKRRYWPFWIFVKNSDGVELFVTEGQARQRMKQLKRLREIYEAEWIEVEP